MCEQTNEGLWGPVLAELTLLSDVFLPLKSSARIKYLSFDVSKCYLIFGASTGSIYIFQRNPLKFLQVLANKDGAITQICLAPDDNLIGYATSKGLVIIMEHNIDKRGNQMPKRLQLSYEHKTSQITALKWNSTSSRLFAGDDKGRVSVINILSSKARFLLQLPTVVIMRLDSKVVELDFAQNKLAASTLTKCYLCDTIEEQYNGHFGVCFHSSSKLQTPLIYATRPGSRLWEIDFQGTVLSTHQFKDALALPPQLVITKGCESKLSSATGNYPPQTVNFGRILSLGNKYLITWTDNSIYIFDPNNATVVLWTDAFHDIRDIKCYKFNLFITLSDGTLRTVRLISPDKLVQHLITRHEWVLAAHVALNYQLVLTDTNSHYHLPPTALREVQSHLTDVGEVQLANCIDILASKLETLASSSVSSSVSGRSGSTESYSRHESGVLIVNSKATPASDSDDDAQAQLRTRYRFRHMRSSSGGRYRTASSPRVDSSPFRPISPCTSSTLPRQSQRTKSASPGFGDAIVTDGVNDLCIFRQQDRGKSAIKTVPCASLKSFGASSVGTRTSAFHRVVPRREKSKAGLEKEFKAPKVPQDAEIATHVVTKAKKSKPQNVNVNKNLCKGKEDERSEKGKITLMFPCYAPYAFPAGLEPTAPQEQEFVSVSIPAPAVLTDLKDSFNSTIRSGKDTLWQTMEGIGDKFKRRGLVKDEEELLDVGKGDSTKAKKYQTPQDEFRVTVLKCEPFPHVEKVEELVKQSRVLVEIRDEERRKEVLREWFGLLNLCQTELRSKMSELVVDEEGLKKMEQLVYLKDPFGMDLTDHAVVCQVAMMCFEWFNVVCQPDFVGENVIFELETGDCGAPCDELNLAVDLQRAVFVVNFFHLLNPEEVRCSLLKKLSPRFNTWLAVLRAVEETMGEDALDDLVDVNKWSEKDVCRLLVVIKRLMSVNPSRGVDFCVRARSLVTPVDVSYLCRATVEPMVWLDTYWNKILTGSWFGLHSVSSVDFLADDEEFYYIWISFLLSKNSFQEGKCSCGFPSPWAHFVMWPQGNILWQLVKKKSRWQKQLLTLCYKSGYWPGYLYLSNRLKDRLGSAKAVVQLGDVHLIDCDSDYGFFPENEDEWRLLLSLMVKRHACEGQVTCLDCEKKLSFSRPPTITWNRIALSLLQHLGPEETTLNLLREIAEEIPPNEINGDFLSDLLSLSLIKMEQKSSSKICELSQSTPFFVGSEIYHLFEAEKQESKSSGALARFNSGAISPSTESHHWGLPLKLHDDCAVCSLPLILGTSASVHGIVLAGCAILGVGIWLYVAYGGYANLLPSYSALSADSLCIAAGSLTFILAFFGYCGSWFQNRCLLITYLILTSIVFSLEVTAGVLMFYYRYDVSDILRQEFKHGIKVKYLAQDQSGFTQTWDHLQTEFACCGVVNYSDWFHSNAWPDTDWVPDSCCNLPKANLTDCGKKLNPAFYHKQGCLDKLHLWLVERIHVIGLILLASTFLQLFGVTSSLLLCVTLRQRRRRHKI
uniref:Uncharacterized protein n=1 Tax=Strigamia maritima TaxID=126957 RepID=T1IXV8_STRMM